MARRPIDALVAQAFEIPPPILRHVLTGGLDLSQACNTAQITSDPKLVRDRSPLPTHTHAQRCRRTLRPHAPALRERAVCRASTAGSSPSSRTGA
jgi:hypothetical protein